MATIPGFEHDCQTAVGTLRASLVELYATVGAEPELPQDVSRTFKLNKNLTWKLSRLMTAPEARDALQYLPGTGAMRIFLRAMGAAGAPEPLLEQIRAAYDEVEQVVQIHVGDRSTLELVLDGLGPERAERLEVSRKLAFRGNSGVWGVQAKAKLSLAVMAPNPEDGGQLDLVFVRGYLGFRRLRPELNWPMSVRRDWTGEGEPFAGSWEPIEPDQAVGGLPLLVDFSTKPAPDFEMRPSGDGVCYMLPPGPVGNTAALDCFFGDISRAQTSRYQTAADTHGEIVSGITVPVETQLTDILYHRAIADSLEPEVLIYGDPFGNQSMVSGDQSQCSLPINERAYALPGSPPMVSTPLFAGYGRLMTRIYERMGWDPAQFRGVRLQTKYPPMGTNVSLRFALPERPE